MKKTTIKQYLEKIIPKKELNLVNRSFEIVGDIAICEINPKLKKYEKEIGIAIMKTNKSIKTVLKKSGIHKGEFRTQDLIYIGGENKKETIYQENGIKLKTNPETVYFSARLSVERAKLMEKLKENKKVLVMFSGIGPYTFVALKKQPNLLSITSIELNPKGHKYAIENLNLNKNLLKKSNIFKKIILKLKENNLPIFEKKIISNLNKIKINQINGNVKKEVLKFKLNNYFNQIDLQKIIEIQIKNKTFKELFNKFEKIKNKNILINYNNLTIKEINNFKIIYILFQDLFEKIYLKINNKYFLFESKIEKQQLFEFLEGRELLYLNKFDEIYMPLPKDAELFLEDAFKVSKKNTIIHMYDFVEEKYFPTKVDDVIKNYAKKNNLNVEIIETRKVGQYAPGKYRVCSDFKII